MAWSFWICAGLRNLHRILWRLFQNVPVAPSSSGLAAAQMVVSAPSRGFAPRSPQGVQFADALPAAHGDDVVAAIERVVDHVTGTRWRSHDERRAAARAC